MSGARWGSQADGADDAVAGCESDACGQGWDYGYPPAGTGGRRVRVDGVILGTAYSLHDLSVFLCRAGLKGLTEVDLAAEDPIEYVGELIEWRGGGPQVWA